MNAKQQKAYDRAGGVILNAVRRIAAGEPVRELDLSNWGLTALPPEIGQLPGLERLYLYGNELSALPAELGRLTALTELNVGHNRLTRLPEVLWQLTSLRQLHLHQNGLSELTEALTCLSHLEVLNVHASFLTTLPDWLPRLSCLKVLYLGNAFGGCPLRHLPECLRHLPQLEELRANDCELESLPDWLGELPVLRGLRLENNRLTALPASLQQLKKLHTLDLRGNPGLEFLGPELLSNTNGGAQEILAQYFRLRPATGLAKTRALKEVKVLVVGEPGVGKTSLIRGLFGDGFDAGERTTEGIRRVTKRLPCGARGEVALNVWDFGGQEIMQATHQLFLTARSVYVLVLDSRENERQGRIDYWLRIIESYGGDSPVIVVGNRSDEGKLDLAWETLSGKFPQIKAFAKKVCCFTGKVDGRQVDLREGLEELRGTLAQVIEQHVTHIDTELPEAWHAVKEHLRKDGRDCLTKAEYVQVCREHGVQSEEDVLLRQLHDLGIVLHYGDHAVVRDNHVLDPAWVTDPIYKVVLDGPLRDDLKARLTRPYLRRIMDGTESHTYARGTEEFLMEMLRKFKLGYDFAGAKEPTLLLPGLLPRDPGYRGEWPERAALRWKYDVLPDSVISRAIVALHGRLAKDSAWRSGCILQMDGAMARMEADYELATIEVKVAGNGKMRRSLLAVIRAALEDIHRQFEGRLGELAQVPTGGRDKHGKPLFEDYDTLLDMEGRGETTYYVAGVGRIPLSELLDGFTSRDERDTERAQPAEDRGKRGAKTDTPTPKPHTIAEEPWCNSWPVKAGGGAVGAFVVARVLFALFDDSLTDWLRGHAGALSFCAAVLVFVLMLRHNPATKYFRLLRLLCCAALVLNIGGPVIDAKGWLGSLHWDGAISTGTNWVLGVAICVVGFLEWQHQKKPPGRPD